MARKLHGHSYGYGKNPETLLMHEVGKKDGMWPSHKMTEVHGYGYRHESDYLDGITLNGSKIDLNDPEIDDLTDAQVDAEFAGITSNPEMAEWEKDIDLAYKIGSRLVGKETGKEDQHLGHHSRRNEGRKSKIKY